MKRSASTVEASRIAFITQPYLGKEQTLSERISLMKIITPGNLLLLLLCLTVLAYATDLIG